MDSICSLSLAVSQLGKIRCSIGLARPPVRHFRTEEEASAQVHTALFLNPDFVLHLRCLDKEWQARRADS
jgi:hypothetical protein